ncbi:iron chelate uptake ABC transporter family permease subunit [Brevibacterium sp. BRM-1]|uniref:FecCD family ABC transporter permease n=1 Tax=Brevibacterium sp. BRM-1 TaxID=2999062 RepID=UPI002281E4AC|nr:iron chelate uptake ABC transporter family permease subunit [Brevibacterium sp. BRM-1]WAL41470.1 iron chelate uptake ABC transporter family permease subunit [Brevibacterium sp. BRM-1]
MTVNPPQAVAPPARRPRTRGSARAGSRFATLRLGGLSLRFEPRLAAVCAIGTALAAAVFLVSLMIGDYGLSAGESLTALFGGSDDRLANYFVQEVRLPRAVGALLVGAALGISGALFQVYSGNPLGSPDIIGFSAGSSTGAIIAIIVFGGSGIQTPLGALLGGLAAAGLISLLAGGLATPGFRMVLIGIGASAALKAVDSLLLVRAPLEAAQHAAQWNVGSLNGMSFGRLLWLAPVLVAVIPLLVWLAKPLAVMPMGAEASIGLGVPILWVRRLTLAAGVVLVSLATAVAGPIAFVALAAPHIARRLGRTAGAALGTSAVLGALLVSVSDIVAQRIFAPNEIAVGIVTSSVGGVYLIILLFMEFRRGTV